MGKIIICNENNVILRGRVNPSYAFWLDELVKIWKYFCCNERNNEDEIRDALYWTRGFGIFFRRCDNGCAVFETANDTDLDYYGG